MRHQLSTYLDNAITLLLLFVAGLTPLLFLNLTTEFFEMPKLVFLIVSTVILLGLWVFSWIAKGKIVITRTPLDIPLLLLLVGVIASTYFSNSQYASIYGNFPKVHGSAAAWITYILLYFVTVSNLKNWTQIRSFLYVLYGSGAVVALLSLLSFFNLFLPFDFAKAANFTPTGSSFSTVAFLLILLPLPLYSIINPNRYMPSVWALVLATLFGVTVVLIGSIPSYAAFVIAIAFVLFVSRPQQLEKTWMMFLVPIGVIALTLMLAYVPLLPGGLNKINELESNFPKEIQLPLGVSWKVSASAFRDAPFIGTGPSTYLFNFTQYKPAEFNALRFWNFSFDTAHNEFLHTLGTLGLVGFLGLIFFALVTLNTSRKNLVVPTYEGYEDTTGVLLPALAISGVVSIVLLIVHATTLVSVVVTLFMLAVLMASQRSVRERVVEFSLGLKATTASNRQFDVFPIIIFVVFLIAAVPLLYRLFNVVAADYYHRQALTQANKNGQLTYQYLQKAETMNPYIDLYRVDMAQTNFALANAIASNAIRNNTNAASPAAALSDQDRRTIQTLLSQSVNEGRAGIALSPRSARNWEVLASIYRNITGVANNALAFSLDAYGRAIQLDPLNPALRVNVGGLYYAARNYDLATRFFTDAANLKPDYANAYFNLSIALRDKGDLKNAEAVAQQTVRLLQANKNDANFKVANDLLKDLQARIATGSAQQTGQAAPAAETNSALSNQNLPDVNVNNLNNPPQVATPSAVSANPNARVPQPTATPAPTRRVTPTVRP